MANFEMKYMTCPVCKSQQTMKIYTDVDATSNKKLREKIMLNKLLEFSCKTCGYTDQNFYPFLYTDLEDKILVWHIPDATGENIEEIVKEINDNHELEERENEEFQFRVVTDYNSLKEKIIIRNTKLDDRYVEVMKLFLLNVIMTSENPINVNALEGIFFNKHGEDNWTMDFVIREEEGVSLKVTKDMYDEIYSLSKEATEQVSKDMELRGFSLVDKSFGEAVMKLMIEENLRG